MAWRLEHQLREPEKRSQWLAGIARNLSLHWRRRRGLELERFGRPRSGQGQELQGVDGWPPDAFDLEVELERHELSELLDRAMSLLPPDTRDLLVERYVNESPYAETAIRLGLTEDAVAKRVERGRLALRRVLTTELSGEAAEYGLFATGGGWQETRIWCPMCGRRRLLGRFERASGQFTLRCSGCCIYDLDNFWHTEQTEVLGDVKGYKAALSRLMAWTDDYYGLALGSGDAACTACGRPTRLQMGLPEDAPTTVRDVRGVHQQCEVCGATSWAALSGLARAGPEARAFWREHPRIRTLPEREIEVVGSPALIVGFESTLSPAKLDVIVVRDTLQVIAVHRSCC